MTQELTKQEAELVAGGGLYDHLPAPRQPRKMPQRSSMAEKRSILEQLGYNEPLRQLIPSYITE